MKIGYSGVQIENSSRPPDLTETKLLLLLTSCGAMGLLNEGVAAGRPHHLVVVNMFERRKLTNRCSITRELVGAYRVWDIVFFQQALEEEHYRVGLSASLKKNLKNGPVLVDGSPAARRAQAEEWRAQARPFTTTVQSVLAKNSQ